MMTEQQQPQKRTVAKKNMGVVSDDNENTLYNKTMLETTVVLLPTEIGENATKNNIKTLVSAQLEGKCCREGYVKPNSVVILQYSCGLVKGEYIEFKVIFECKTCYPVEGTWLKHAEVDSVTKAGIHAYVYDSAGNVPVTIFVARDHFADNRYFNSIQPKEFIDVKIIGIRFEMNDQLIEVLGNLIAPRAGGGDRK